jgi:hypothetical protein
MRNKRRWAWAGFTAAASLAAAVAVAAVGYEEKKPARVPVPTVNIVQGDRCVEPTEDMRRNHMNYILHQRDETMRRGIRTTRHSLKNCINCHADPETNSVLGENGFCQTCHTYAAVTIDCFGCHTHKREPDAKVTGRVPTDLAAMVQAAEVRP